MIDLLNQSVLTKTHRSGDVIHIDINGHSFKMDLTDEFNSRFINFAKRGNGFKENEVYEPATSQALVALSKKYDIKRAYDIGCQNLYTTLQMQRIFDCDVVGYDIDEKALNAARINLKLNGSAAVEIIERGIGDGDDGNLTLNDLDGADLFFIDIEGYQAKVFESGLPWIEKHRPIIVYETDNPVASLWIKPDRKILEPISNIDYVFYLCSDHRKNKPFNEIDCQSIPEADGLLVCIPREKL
jgi:predicted O-methyltransferase YrrM